MSAEYLLAEDAVILSTADLQGNILTFNQTFLVASGYEADEIQGKPHSILRHPDMPKAAFKDLWDTINDGRPWFGIVKNKRKNGDYYWVAASVSPVFENQKLTSYVSVRYAASAQQKAEAEALYAKVNRHEAKLTPTPHHKIDPVLLISLLTGIISLFAFFNAENHNFGFILAWIAFAVAVWRGHQLARPSRKQQQAIQAIANGHFRTPVPGYNAWSNALNLLRTRIGQNASDIIQESANDTIRLTQTMQQSAHQITDALSSQASTASEMSASIAEITSTMEELSASSTQVAENAKVVAEIANQAITHSAAGSEAMQVVMTRMQSISDDNQNSLKEIMDLGSKSKEISKIMSLITNLAEQTKLIAFNAALEASSAGEAGKRFSVVAGEIRRLADSVTDSTNEIESKIDAVQDAINRLIITSEKGANGILAGTSATNTTAERLNAIIESISQTNTAAQQISLSTQQQKIASNQVVIALREIMSASSQTASAINRIAQISEAMEQLSTQLSKTTELIKH